MPFLLSRHLDPSSTFGIWQIAEPESFFRKGLALEPGEELELALHKDLRRLEWLASRFVLHRLTGLPERLPLRKDVFSKPFFLDQPDLYCSLSHSQGVVGVLLSDRPCGCDIQVVVDKMPRLAHKFMHPEEAAFAAAFPSAVQLELFHIFWTAKESMYKNYGLKALDFKGHMRLMPFMWDGYAGQAEGRIDKADFSETYRLQFEKIELPQTGALIWTLCFPEIQEDLA